MKITKNKSNKKTVIIVIVSLLIVSASIFAYYTLRTAKSTDNAEINYGAPTKEETTTGNSIKDSSQTTGGSDQSPSPTPSDSTATPTVGMEITAANQNGGTLYIRTLIQTVTTSGTCTLTMSGPGSFKTTSSVQALPSTSTCAGFDVPVSSLSVGTWTISVSFANDTVTASASKEVTIE